MVHLQWREERRCVVPSGFQAPGHNQPRPCGLLAQHHGEQVSGIKLTAQASAQYSALSHLKFTCMYVALSNCIMNVSWILPCLPQKHHIIVINAPESSAKATLGTFCWPD